MSQACSKCNSDRMIPNVRMLDRNHTYTMDFSAEICEQPDALLFKGPVQVTITANICGNCGYCEFFANSPNELWQAHRNASRNRKTST